jgi:hypothetical protein
METPIKLEEKFDGHIILYCKGHYDCNVDFFEGLINIWSARCGVKVIDSSSERDGVYEFIANRLIKIIKLTTPKKMEYVFERLHKELAYKPIFQYEIESKSSSIQKCIELYVDILRDLKVNDHDEYGKVFPLITLPKPQKRLFKKIIREGCKGGEYYQVIG